MDFITLLSENKTVLGGIFIGCATITGVTLNIFYSKIIDSRLKKEKTASTASALAAELLYNSYSLRQLYLEIAKQTAKKPKVTEYKHIDLQVYQELLINIGELGSSLTFMVVDAYGDIKKVQGRMEVLSDEGVMNKDKKSILKDIKLALVKTLSCSIAMYLYSDYMNGRKWIAKIRDQRVIRIERTLEGFCRFVEKTEYDIDFITSKEEGDLEFRKRFQGKEERRNIKELFASVQNVLNKFSRYNLWQAQLSIRALSYKIQNRLVMFLGIEPDEYDVLSEQEYEKFL